MGEIAEMMLDGTLCEGCGEYLGSDAGYPQYCSPECGAGRGGFEGELIHKPRAQPHGRRKHKCDQCDRHFRSEAAMLQHWRAKHGNGDVW